MKDYTKYFRTVNGHHIFPSDLDLTKIYVSDISVPLSNICRYAGHISMGRFYSVAEHSVLVSELIEFKGGTPQECLTGLFHDGTEAFVGDCPTPFKNLIKDFKNVENMVYSHLAKRFGLLDPIPQIVEDADKHAFILECKVLRDFVEYSQIQCLSPKDAAFRFEQRFRYLESVII